MGSFGSKLLRSNCSDGAVKKDKSKEEIEATKSSCQVSGISKTPDPAKEIIIKEKPNNAHYGQHVLKNRNLINLKVDPRSPSDGINRTPILIDSTPLYKSSLAYNASDSCLSIYSQNLNDINLSSNVVTPAEPSVNVSGFEDCVSSTKKDVGCTSFQIDYFNENYDLNNSSDEKNFDKLNDNPATPLKVSNKPSTLKARKLLNEILSLRELEKEYIADSKKHVNKLQNFKSHSVHCDVPDTKTNERKRDKLKHRTPLSNITLSTNSPSLKSGIKKPYSKCKIVSDIGLENSENQKIIQVVEWDKDKTVII